VLDGVRGIYSHVTPAMQQRKLVDTTAVAGLFHSTC
jgi:hypothetical protein